MKLIFLVPPVQASTQAARIEAAYEIPQLSTGDMLRAAVAAGTEMITKGQRHYGARRFGAGRSGCEHYFRAHSGRRLRQWLHFGRFPAKVSQARALDGVLVEKSIDLDAVIELAVDPEILIARILKRAQEQPVARAMTIRKRRCNTGCVSMRSKRHRSPIFMPKRAFCGRWTVCRKLTK